MINMLKRSSLFWFPSILIITQNLGLVRGILKGKWIEQYQDHFNSSNQRIWFMRYYENNEFYHRSGPIFIMIGGEAPLTPEMIEANYIMYEMAEIHGAMMYSIEHRYYGQSHPVPDTSLENLRYLSVPQALSDVALFIEMKKRELNRSNAFTMVFGCSYAGNLAAWMRVMFPNLVHGALASSAPIYVKSDFSEFYEFVGNSLRKHDENCAINIEEAFSVLTELLKSPAINSFKVENDFMLCRSDIFQPSDISFLTNTLAKIFAHAVLYNTIEINGQTSIENICISMRKDDTISSYYRLAGVFKKKYLGNDSCINLEYRASLEALRQTSWESVSVADRLWIYQTCTELGGQTFSSSKSIFGSLISQEYFNNLCRDTFTVNFHLDHLNHNIRRLNWLYNSKLSDTTNIIFTNGDLDPWRRLSVLSDLNADSPAILIEDATHCEFVKRGQTLEKSSIIAARCQVSFMIHTWLQKWFA